MRSVALAFTSAAFLASSVLAADSANLGPTFEQGSKSRYELNNKISQLINAPQGEMTVNIENTVVLICEVIEANDQGATVTATIEEIRASMDTPMFSDGFDSDSPEEEDASSQVAPFIRPILGQSFVVKFDATGANADVEGVDRLLPSNPQVAPLVAQLINAQGLGQAVAGFYVLKDGHEMVSTGEKWSNTETQPAPPLGTITITINSALESITNSIAKVVVDGEAVFNAAPPAQTQGASMSIDESEIDGTIEWNTENDMLKSAQSNTIMVISMTNPAMPEAKESMRIVNNTKTRRLD